MSKERWCENCGWPESIHFGGEKIDIDGLDSKGQNSYSFNDCPKFIAIDMGPSFTSKHNRTDWAEGL